jgi:hypothetical protein
MTARDAGRRLSICLLTSACCLLAGCNMFLAKREAPEAKGPRVPVGDTSGLTTERLVAYLNSHAEMVQSIDANDISLTVRGPGTPGVTLDGTLMVQKPRYFRLVGKHPLTGTEVVVGSNQERFWFYVPKMQDALMHCSYSDFDRGVDLPFPFDPQWVPEALGMAPVSAEGAKQMEKDEKAGTVRLIQDGTLHGQRVKKVTVCYLAPTSRDVPQVKSRIVYDERGKVICQATIKSVTRMPIGPDRAGKMVYAEVPKVVKLEWPAQEASLELDLGKARINQPLPMSAFQMPDLGSRRVDLGRDRPTGRGVVPAQFR